MIYEVTTYDLKPRVLPRVEELFAIAYPARKKHSELLGSFRTEFGPLNQIVQIWKFADLAERERVVQAVIEEGAWPPPIAEHLVRMRTEIMRPTPISPELKPGKLGPYYELRTYVYPLGSLSQILKIWGRTMAARDALGSPVAAIWVNEIGALNTLTHLWPYPSLEERERIRKEIRVSGLWPPYKRAAAEGWGDYEILSQANKLMLPASFSPLQ